MLRVKVLFIGLFIVFIIGGTAVAQESYKEKATVEVKEETVAKKMPSYMFSLKKIMREAERNIKRIDKEAERKARLQKQK